MRVIAFSSTGAFLALALTLLLPGCGGGSASDSSAAPVAAASGVQITDVKPGTGLTPRPGQTCVVHYTGWLYVNGARGAKFDSSVDRKRPFSFVLGEHKVIEGWERAMSGMKAGGKRTVIIPPELGYGAAGAGANIPPNSTLIFDIELLDIRAS